MELTIPQANKEHKSGPAVSQLTWNNLPIQATAELTRILHSDNACSDFFSISYALSNTTSSRPVTFALNGGPGASSAYIHVGGIGPFIAKFTDNGDIASVPTETVESRESWLSFTDLVFIDPVGTGYSRIVASETESVSPNASPNFDRHFHTEHELEHLAHFIVTIINQRHYWGRPIYLMGESYGGFRVAKLVNLLHEKMGLGLAGIIMVSPVFELSFIGASDYDVLPWVCVVPTMTAIAHYFEKLGNVSLATALEQSENFCLGGDLASLLISGDRISQAKFEEVTQNLAQLTGLGVDYVRSHRGRLSYRDFCYELLRSQHLICGIYDGTIVTHDPFTNRHGHQAPDPTNAGFKAAYGESVRTVLTNFIGFKTDRSYILNNKNVWIQWQRDSRDLLNSHIGATDDLRYALSLNKRLKVMVCHGLHDIITPYFLSKTIMSNMRLRSEEKERCTLTTYPGGHMFYTKAESRKRFFEDGRDWQRKIN